MWDISLCSLVWLLLSVILLIWVYDWYKRPKYMPPGPKGVPLLGAIALFGKYPERTMKEWSKRYGKIMSVRLPLEEMVVLNDYDSIHQAFVKQGHKFSGRPVSAFINQFTYGLGVSTRDYDEHWKIQRKFGLVTLRGMGVGKQTLEMKVIEEISYLNEAIREKKGKTFDPSVLLHNAVSNIICNVVFGQRFEYEDPRFKAIMQGYVDLLSDPTMLGVATILTFMPSLRHLPIISYYNKKILKVIDSVMQLLNDLIEEHQETFDDSNIRDFIDAFLLEMKKEDKHNSFTTMQLAIYVYELFEAGTETTSGTLYWILLNLVHYPEIQQKLREEIKDVIGMEGAVLMQKRNEMPYTCAFVEEIFRCHTLIPIGLQHATTEDAELGSYLIPKGTTVVSNIWAVHNDENLWEQPKQFNPDRFLNEKGQFTRSSHVIPFSVGPRHCLGEQLARMEIFMFLALLLQRYEFLPDPEAETLPDRTSACGGSFSVPQAYKLVAKEL